MSDLNSISAVINDYDSSKLTKGQVVSKLAQMMDRTFVEAGRINDLMMLLDLWGVAYRTAIISDKKYISIIAREGVDGDPHCFAQFEFDQNGYFTGCGVFRHKIGETES